MTVPVLETFQGTDSAGGSSTTVTATKPSGVVSGDLLVIMGFNDATGSGPEFSDNLTGWTFVAAEGEAGTVDCHTGVFWRISDGGESATESITVATSRKWTSHYLRISGSHATVPIHKNNFATDGTLPASNTIPEVTTTVGDCLGLYGIGYGSDRSGMSVAASWVEKEEELTGSGLATSFGSIDIVSAGGSTDAVVTPGTGAAGAVYFQLAIASSGDATAPVLTSPGTSSITAGGCQGDVSSDEGNGTLYFVVSEDSGTPSVAQIQAGNDANGDAGVDSGNQAVSGTDAQAVSVTGLTHNTAYYISYQQQDAATNDSTVTSPSSFTTLEVSCALTGTITPNSTEAEIVTGGKTIILTLTNDTWHADLGSDNAQTDALIAALDSDKSGVTGWDAEVKGNMVFGDVTRTSATICTVILAAEAAYDITSNETIGPVSIPASILVLSTVAVVSDTSFSIVAASSGGSGGISNVITQKLVRQAKKRRKTRVMEKMDHDKSVEEALEELYGKD